MKIAFVHDYLNQYGGAERVLEVMCSLFPHAPIYTTIYDEVATKGCFKDRVIRTSFLQRMPFAKRYHHAFSFLMPLAVEQLNTSDYDVVLSISSSFAKGIITKSHTRHFCYCLTPPRYLWDDSHRYVKEFEYPSIVKKILPPFLSYLRIWDHEASLRPDTMIGISDFVSERIKKYYGRSAPVLYPPVDVSKFYIADEVSDYYLMVGRLVTYKKFDLAIGAFNKLKLPLKVVGTGVDMTRLKKIAGPTVEFLGSVDDARLAELYARARALVFPQEEDFGIVPLEAMASGRPVIAYRGGGAIETVVEGQTGVFFDEQTPESLEAAVTKFNARQFAPAICRMRAEKFDVSVFKEKIINILNDHRY